MEELEFLISKEDAKERIDKYLTAHCSLSRSRIQSLIDEGYVTVNDADTKSNYKLRENDVIRMEIPEEKELKVEPIPMDLDIVYEDHDVIVINKPRGMVVHPADTYKEPTLVNGLLYHCKDLSGINGVLRPGIVHRIDKDTTGLLIVAKNDVAHESLVKQLQVKSVSRKYLAIVHGNIEHDFGTIDAPIGRDKNDRLKMAVVEDGRNAVTHFTVRERFKNYCLVECRLETGRTHQIRVHMAFIHHPVAADKKYGPRKSLDCEGQLLHAYELTFTHPVSGKEITVNCDLPEDFKSILEELRRENGHQ